MSSGITRKRERRMTHKPQTGVSTHRGPDQAASTAGAPEKRSRSNASGKIDALLALLKRDGGATLDELVKVTGWLSHSVRAALTGLKRKGHAIERNKVDGISHYVIAEPVAQ